MKTNDSIDDNGRSTREQGNENYTTFRPAHRPNQPFYQYDYRHSNGELFSTVAPTLEECRSRCDKWLVKRNEMYKLFIGFRKLGEFDSILETKQFADNSNFSGVFTLLGNNYSDKWYVSKKLLGQ